MRVVPYLFIRSDGIGHALYGCMVRCARFCMDGGMVCPCLWIEHNKILGQAGWRAFEDIE